MSAISLQRLEGIDEKLCLITENTAQTSATIQAFSQDIEVISDIVSGNQLDEERRRIHEWLRPPDPYTSHTAARAKHEASTNEWFLHTTEFLSLLDKKTLCLSLYGIPGCGKTVLVSSVISYLENNLGNNETLLYFYFDFNDREKQTVRGCLASLFLQLAFVTDDFFFINSLFAECAQGSRGPTLQQISDCLTEAIRKHAPLILVFDALDECVDEETFLDFISLIPGVRILITSRRRFDPEFETKLVKSQAVNVQQVLVEGDIKIFIRSRLQQNTRLSKWCRDPKIKEEIESTLLIGANGMYAFMLPPDVHMNADVNTRFRWVAYQIDELRKCLTLSSLRQTLRTLPKTLYDTYDRILLRIDPAYHQMTLRALQWLCVCRRPLTIGEVAEAVAILDDDGTTSLGFDVSNRLSDPADIFTICSGLIFTSATENASAMSGGLSEEPISLAHYSVKEYLISTEGAISDFHILEVEANAVLAAACIKYLIHNGATDQHMPLAKYAALHWNAHLELAQRRSGFERLESRAIQLLESKEAMRKLWLLKKPHYPLSSWVDKPALHWATHYGLNSLAIRLLESSTIEIEKKDKAGRTVLQDAVRYRNHEMAGELIRNGADVDTSDENGVTALHFAIFNHDLQMARLLLQAGANPNFVTKFGKPPIFSSAERSNDEILQLLLEHKADPNVKSNFHPDDGPSKPMIVSVLEASAWNGHLSSVKILLDHGAYSDVRSLQLLAQGDIQEGLAEVSKTGAFDYTWHNSMLDYTPMSNLLRAYVKVKTQ